MAQRAIWADIPFEADSICPTEGKDGTAAENGMFPHIAQLEELTYYDFHVAIVN